MKRQLTKEDLDSLHSLYEDLEKYGDKLNAMVLASAEGDCPQSLR